MKKRSRNWRERMGNSPIEPFTSESNNFYRSGCMKHEFWHLPTCLPVYLSIYLSVGLFVCLFIYLYFCQSIYLSASSRYPLTCPGFTYFSSTKIIRLRHFFYSQSNFNKSLF